MNFVTWQFGFADKRSKHNVESEKLTIQEVTKGDFDEFIIVQGVVQLLKTE